MAIHADTATSDAQTFGYTPTLRRELRARDLTAYGLIFMVVIAPMGIFGGVFQASSGMIALAYLVGAGAMMFTASSYSLMSRRYPVAGSVYTYTGRAISPNVGFLTGWVLLLDYVGIPLLLSLVAAASMTSFVPAIPMAGWVAIFVITNALINLLGIKSSKKFNWFFLAGSLTVLTLFMVFGIRALAAGKGRGFSFDPLYNGTTFTWALVLGAVSIAVLSFLGFDAIALLAEDTKGSARNVGKAMYAALGLVAVLFIAQSWVAALLVPNPAGLISAGDPEGTSFYDAARVAGGPWLATLCALATAIAWGLANNMVAQVATSRLLFSMSRDGQLPAFLKRVSPKRNVPTNAILTTAAISLIFGLWMSTRDDAITLMSSLVNFGAMTGFVMLHVAVIIQYGRDGWRGNPLRHLVAPLIGAGILIAVIWHASILAQTVGIIWLCLGVVVLLALDAAGRQPRLAGLSPEQPTSGLRREPGVLSGQVPRG